MAQKIKFDPDQITLGDMEDFEDATGRDLFETFTPQVVRDPETGLVVPDPEDPDGRPLKVIKARMRDVVTLAWIIGRKDNPTLTRDDVRKMPVTEWSVEMPDEVPAEDPRVASDGGD